MRFTYFTAGIFCSAAVARNVFNMEELHAAIENQAGNSKRDARNVISLDELKAALDKQENEEANEKRHQDVVSAPLLQNLLPQMSSVSIFAGYLRDDQVILSEVEKKDSFTLLVAPSDSAMADKLSGLKPWEFPKKIMDDDSDDAVVAYNVHHFMKAHILTELESFSDNNELKSHLLDGRELSVTHDPTSGLYLVIVGGVTYPASSVSLANNGIVFVIEDVLSKP